MPHLTLSCIIKYLLHGTNWRLYILFWFSILSVAVLRASAPVLQCSLFSANSLPSTELFFFLLFSSSFVCVCAVRKMSKIDILLLVWSIYWFSSIRSIQRKKSFRFCCAFLLLLLLLVTVSCPTETKPSIVFADHLQLSRMLFAESVPRATRCTCAMQSQMSKHFYVSIWMFVCAPKSFRNQRWRMAELWMRRDSSRGKRERCDTNTRCVGKPDRLSALTLKIFIFEPNKIVFLLLVFQRFFFHFRFRFGSVCDYCTQLSIVIWPKQMIFCRCCWCCFCVRVCHPLWYPQIVYTYL